MRFSSTHTFLVLWITCTVAVSSLATAGSPNTLCRILPGDPSWPTRATWQKLNQTVKGKLIRGLPLAHVCYDTIPDPQDCSKTRAEWTELSPYINDPVNIMSPYWLNNSCSPFQNPGGDCSLGNLAFYTVNVADAASVMKAVQFAGQSHLRLTIKNTGHDFLGRSTGRGSLGLWMANMKDIIFLRYSNAYYKGPAVRVEAGVHTSELYEAASKHGLRVVGGSCPSVGIAGGFIQSGGHGPLGATYGLASDQTLEFEVVTAEGRHLIASPSQNADLYWALSGGGAGNYAIVMAVTIKAYEDGQVAGAAFSLLNQEPHSFWLGVTAWIKHLLVLDTIPGFYSLWAVNKAELTLQYATLTGANASKINEALVPFFDELKALNLTLTTNSSSTHPTFLSHYGYWATQSYSTNDSLAGRLIPRSAVKNNLPKLVSTFRGMLESSALPDAQINGIANNMTHARVGNSPGSNAVLPAWRESLFTMNVGVGLAEDASWDVLRAIQAQLNEWQNQLRGLTPGSGIYINEATFDNPTWQSDYYGANYGRLLAVKNKYDPKGLLWSHSAVGSEKWVVESDGRLCAV